MKFTKYDERGAYHWDLYNDENDIYHKYVNTVIDWIKERPVLDVGAGDGLITHKLGVGSVGIDNNKKAINLANKKGANVSYGDIYQSIPFNKVYEAVFIGDTIEHLKNWKAALSNIRTSIADNGNLYITTPPARADRKLQDKLHYFEWTKEEFKFLVESQGFELQEDIFIKYSRMFGKFKKI